jgi:hypothetical protein
MNHFEQSLAEDLQRTASTVDVPPAPVASLSAAGRRRLRATRLRALAAVAAAVAVVVAGLGAGPQLLTGSTPVGPAHHGPARQLTSLADLPHGARPGVPYWHAGQLHVGGATIRTPHREIVTGGGTTLVGDPWPLHNLARWWLLDETRLVPVVSRPDVTGQPKVSPDGRLVLWEEMQPHATTVVVWDTTRRRVVARQTVQIEAACCDGPSLMLFGVDDQDQVFYGDGRTLTMWQPATGTARTVTGIGRLPAAPTQITATGPVFQGASSDGFNSLGVYGSVTADGVFHRAGTVPSDQSAAWSPDNTRWAYPGDDYGDFAFKAPATQMVLDVATGKTHRMRLPTGVTGDVQWESNNTLLLHVLTGPRRHFMVRCQAESGACELALRMGRTSDWSFPNQL